MEIKIDGDTVIITSDRPVKIEFNPFSQTEELHTLGVPILVKTKPNHAAAGFIDKPSTMMKVRRGLPLTTEDHAWLSKKQRKAARTLAKRRAAKIVMTKEG